jgi:phospholipid transport system substrate-binding protein
VMKKLLCTLVTLLGLAAAPAYADASAAAAPASAAPATPVAPDVVVKSTTSQLQDLLWKNHETYRDDLPGFYKVVDDVLVPHFDVPFIARIVLARYWRTASDDEKQRFQTAFTNMLIRSYANAMLDYYDSVKAEWKPLHIAPDTDDVTVNSNLLREGRQPVAIGFAMHLAGGEWKIYDITVENISLATNFRGQLSSEIKRTSLASVIERMETGEFSTAKPKAAATS